MPAEDQSFDIPYIINYGAFTTDNVLKFNQLIFGRTQTRKISQNFESLKSETEMRPLNAAHTERSGVT